MKCILLCAGYATRLFPLTENFPKALLDIEAGKPLLDYILDEVNTIDIVDEIYLITNAKYYNHFNDWAMKKNNVKKMNNLYFQ
jgi:glucose-1-phosphate thymidylyltransferase